jgi:hypothetical protein
MSGRVHSGTMDIINLSDMSGDSRPRDLFETEYVWFIQLGFFQQS